MIREINTRNDIDYLVRLFYKKVRADKLLGPIFDLMIPREELWEHHFSKLIDFWEANLLRSGKYEGAMVELHLWVDMQISFKMDQHHLDRWLELWKETLVQNFKGPISKKAYQHAESIGQRILSKVKKAKPY